MTALALAHEVSVTYGRRDAEVRALDRVDFEVQEGETVALLGRSGSGKTTLLHVLGGLLAPTDGAVEWKGSSLVSLDHAARRDLRRRGIAYVFQGANLLPYFTAYENVAFAARELVAMIATGCLSWAALAQSPELLLCDEPTGHLDSDTGDRVLDLIDALQREFGFALVVATHDPDVAARLDRAVEMLDGRIGSEQVAA